MFPDLPHAVGVRREKRQPDPESVEAIGKRLKALRDALDLTQAVMGQAIGSSTTGQMWGNYELGTRRISIDQALALCRRFGVTLDWVYRGQIQFLPTELVEKILYQETKADISAHKRQ